MASVASSERICPWTNVVKMKKFMEEPKAGAASSKFVWSLNKNSHPQQVFKHNLKNASLRKLLMKQMIRHSRLLTFGPFKSDLSISTCDLSFHQHTVRFCCYMPSSKHRAQCLEAKYPLHKQCIITSVSQFLPWKRLTNGEGLLPACQNKAWRLNLHTDSSKHPLSYLQGGGGV